MTRSATFIGRFPLEIPREVYKCLCPVWTKPSEYGSLRLTCRQIHQEYDAESVKVTNDYYETVEKDYGAKITKPQTFNDIKNVVMVRSCDATRFPSALLLIISVSFPIFSGASLTFSSNRLCRRF